MSLWTNVKIWVYSEPLFGWIVDFFEQRKDAMEIIKNFNPADYGRWNDTGLFWDKQTGEAITVNENVVNTGGGFLYPRQTDDGGSETHVMGGDSPGVATQGTVYIRTGYFFEINVTQNLPYGDNLDSTSADQAIEPWGFAQSQTASKVYEMLRPFIEALGGQMKGFGAGDENMRFKYSQLQRCIVVEFDGVRKQIPAGPIAQRLAGAISWDPVRNDFMQPLVPILRETAESSAAEARKVEN